MGTKVQYKSYLPGYYSTRDLNEDAPSHGWPIYYEETVTSGQFYGNFTPRSENGYGEYDREALKETMLNHEAVFRKQVHELHRLYRKQRELMEEFKLKEQCCYALQSHSPLPSTSSMGFLANNAETMHPASRIWEINCNNSSQSVSGRETSDNLKILNNESRQTSILLTESGDSLKRVDQDAKSGKYPRVMIDLQLPADVYIDNQEEKEDEVQGALPLLHVAESPNHDYDLKPEKYAKLNLGSGGTPNGGESFQRSLRSWDAERAQGMSDLNDPIHINGLSRGVMSTFSSECLRGKAPYLDTTHWHKPMLNSNSSFINMRSFQEQHKGAGSSSMEQQLFSGESGRSRTSLFVQNVSSECVQETQRPEESKLKRTCDLSSFPITKTMKIEPEFQEKMSSSNKLFGISVGGTSYSASSSLLLQGSGARIPPSAHARVPSFWDSSPAKQMHGTPYAPIDVDALPLFDKSVPLIQTSNSSKAIFPGGTSLNGFLPGRSLASNQSIGSEALSYPNVFPDDQKHQPCFNWPPTNDNKGSRNLSAIISSQENSNNHGLGETFSGSGNKYAKPLKDVDLNIDLSEDCHEEFPTKKESNFSEPERINLNSATLPWVNSSPLREPHINLNMSAPTEQSTQDFGRMEPERYSSSSYARPAVKSSKPADYVSSKCINGTDMIPLHPSSLCRNDMIDLEKPPSITLFLEDDAQDKIHSQRNEINLNFVPSLPCITEKFHLQIDLEAPAIPEIDDDELCCTETLDADSISMPLEVPKCGVNEKVDTGGLHDGVAEAAEIIVAMSSNANQSFDSAGSRPSSGDHAESLMWFADVVCFEGGSLLSSTHNVPNRVDGHENVCYDDIDFFEYMTLKLTEIKPEDYWIKSHKRENPNNNEAGFASLLVGKAKRGQARKRRQKRDFQKDILPGLASLSRHEATEDLQTIGGLMRASGQLWEMGLTRRNAGRGGNSRSRGGRRARGGASPATKNRVSPTNSTPPNNTEIAVNGVNMVGWGRTRRCRRPRCPSGNIVPLLPRE